MSDITVKHNPADMLQRMGPDVYREAYKEGVTLSAFLEAEDPTTSYPEHERDLDAFGRLLQAAGMRTNSLPILGLPASTWEDFTATPQTRALIPEWAARIMRRVQHGVAATRGTSPLASSDYAIGGFARPYGDYNAVMWDTPLAPAVPLSELVAATVQIASSHYRAFYMTDDGINTGMYRVAEGAEIPATRFVGAANVVPLYKYGRRLDLTYEVLRRMPVDLIELYIQRVAVRSEIDKVGAAISVLINGDGNSNAATSYDLTDIDTAATAGTLTLKGYLGFKLKFGDELIMTAALVQEAVALQMMLLQMGSAAVPLVTLGNNGIGGFVQINRALSDAVRLGVTSAAPALKIVGLDARQALIQVYEIGGTVTETARFVERQTETLVLSEVVGFAKMNEAAVKVLDINA